MSKKTKHPSWGPFHFPISVSSGKGKHDSFKCKVNVERHFPVWNLQAESKLVTERIYDTTQIKSSSLGMCKKGFFPSSHMLSRPLPGPDFNTWESTGPSITLGKCFPVKLDHLADCFSFSFSLHLNWFLIWWVTSDKEEWIGSLGSLGKYLGNLTQIF